MLRATARLSFVVRKDIPEGNNRAGCMMLSDATQNGIHSFVVRKDIQRSKTWWRMRRNLILSFVVRKDIPEGNNSAGCNESHSLFCSQKSYPKLQNHRKQRKSFPQISSTLFESEKSGGCNEMSSPPLSSVSLLSK